MKRKSCTSSPEGERACARTPAPPCAKSPIWSSGTKTLQRPAEKGLADRAPELVPAHRGVAKQEVPKTAVGHGLNHVAKIDVGQAISFASQRQHCIGTSLYARDERVKCTPRNGKLGSELDKLDSAPDVVARPAACSTRLEGTIFVAS